MTNKDCYFRFSTLIGLAVSWLLLLQFLRYFFSYVFYLNLGVGKLNFVSFIFTLCFVTPLILYLIPKKFDKHTFIVTPVLALICRLVLAFDILPMITLVISSLGVAFLLIWVTLLFQNKRKVVFKNIGSSFILALMIDLVLRMIGNTFDITLTLIGSIVLVVVGSIAFTAMNLTDKFAESKDEIKDEIIVNEKDTSVKFFPLFVLSITIVSLIMLVSTLLIYPNVQQRWKIDTFSKGSTEFWLITWLEFALLAGIFLTRKMIHEKIFSKLHKGYTMAISFVGLSLIVLFVFLEHRVFLYLSLISLPVLLILFDSIALDSFKYLRNRKKWIGAFALSTFIGLLLYLLQTFAFNFAYVPKAIGSLLKNTYPLFIAIPAIIALLSLVLIWKKSQVIKLKSNIKLNTIFIGFLLIGMIFATSLNQPKLTSVETAPSTIKVCTYNIFQGFNEEGEFNYETVYSVLLEINADIIGLQETQTGRITNLNSDIVRYLATKLNYYFYQVPSISESNNGLALLSRFPITEASVISLPSSTDNKVYLSATIDLGNKEINVIVAHLSYDQTNADSLDNRINQATTIINSPHASDADLLIGDFNTIPNLAEYVIIRTLFNDSWLSIYPSGVNGTGYDGYTAEDAGEDIRIDYIFYKNIICTDCEVITEAISADHKPVVAIFSI